MLKKILTLSLLGVSALAIMNVNATTTSDTDQNNLKDLKPTHAVTAKHAKKHHKAKRTPVVEEKVETNQVETISVQPTNTGIVPTGVYVTGQLGYAQNGLEVPKVFGISTTDHLSNGFAGRLALGYKINPNMAVEAGFLKLHNGSFSAQNAVGNQNAFSKQDAIDVLAKGILPIAQNINVYGKVGVAYLTTKTTENSTVNRPVYLEGAPPTPINPTPINPIAIAPVPFSSVSGATTQHNWAPEVAVGVSYDVTPNISVDTSITHIHPVGSNKPGNINFMAVGLGYTFG